MCKGNYSCTINEASNFESSFVIAHEIGHSLGIMHDGQKNRCDPNGFIMSERTGAGKVHWSKCSNQYLNDSIQRGHLACLDMETSGQRVDSLYDLDKLRQPGQVYSINEQCKMAFGSNFTSFVSQQQQPFNVSCQTSGKLVHFSLQVTNGTCLSRMFAENFGACRAPGRGLHIRHLRAASVATSSGSVAKADASIRH